MSANAQLVRSYLDRVWNKRDFTVLDEVADEHVVNTGPMTEEFQGRQGLKNFAQLFLGAFQVNMQIVDQSEEGNVVTTRILYTGKNTGEFMGKPATNRSAEVPVTEHDYIENGKIVRTDAEWDPNGLMMQLYG